jgi:hypothetical protein
MKEVGAFDSASKSSLRVGDAISIGEQSYEITKVVSATDLGREIGVHVARSVPVYFLNGVSRQSRGAYQPERDIVLAFTNTDEETLRHELTHVVEYAQEKSSELLDFYERAKRLITEDSI